MDYSLFKLANTADCDAVLDRGNQEKAALEHRLGGLVLETSDNGRTLAQVNANLISVNAQIMGLTAAIDTMPEGPEKIEMGNRLRRLGDRKANLEERLSKSGSRGLLLTEMQRGLIEKQVAELTDFISAVETRKAAL